RLPMTYENLIVARDGALAVVTVNRPSVLNALNASTMDELRRAALELRHASDVRVVIVTGAGDKAFVAGADINELAQQVPVQGREMALRGQHVFDLIERMGKPVIAAINGFALGGGCELAMACTFRIAADTAQMGQPEINLGIIPGYAGTQRLARLVGPDRAMDLILTGRRVPAQEALAMGLVTRVVPAASLMDEVRAFARELAGKPPVAVRLAMDAIMRGLDLPFAEGSALEASLFGLVATTEDMREGTRAFLEKRKPTFTGR
ncbi:MAG TPA: enoyl-CoA hydratase-related protein, partial [Candidatus Binatia bacterium]|nr:enoyl-CoA hydratase-related protein [Candidatus Binatia bacterium]